MLIAEATKFKVQKPPFFFKIKIFQFKNGWYFFSSAASCEQLILAFQVIGKVKLVDHTIPVNCLRICKQIFQKLAIIFWWKFGLFSSFVCNDVGNQLHMGWFVFKDRGNLLRFAFSVISPTRSLSDAQSFAYFDHLQRINQFVIF